MKHILVINRVQVGGDCSYPMQNIHNKICKNDAEVFDFIGQIMESLQYTTGNEDLVGFFLKNSKNYIKLKKMEFPLFPK